MISKVTDRLWRGPHPENFDVLKKIGVTLCIDLQTAWDDVSYAEDVESVKLGIIVQHFPIGDVWFPSQGYLDTILNAIRAELKKGGTVYVHCTKGVDRTGLICCLYRVIDCGWAVNPAIIEWEAMGMHWFPYSFPLNWPGQARKALRERVTLDRRTESK